MGEIMTTSRAREEYDLTLELVRHYEQLGILPVDWVSSRKGLVFREVPATT